jgi:hypothetical protein
MSSAEFLGLFKGLRRCGNGWTAKCPAHDDNQNSLKLDHRDGKWLIHCHAGCEWQEVLAALGLNACDLFDNAGGGGGRLIPADNHATVQPQADASAAPVAALSRPIPPPPASLTLEQYAAAKQIPVEFLKTCGVSEFTSAG